MSLLLGSEATLAWKLTDHHVKANLQKQFDSVILNNPHSLHTLALDGGVKALFVLGDEGQGSWAFGGEANIFADVGEHNYNLYGYGVGTVIASPEFGSEKYSTFQIRFNYGLENSHLNSFVDGYDQTTQRSRHIALDDLELDETKAELTVLFRF